jgi:hypothetical protein
MNARHIHLDRIADVTPSINGASVSVAGSVVMAPATVATSPAVRAAKVAGQSGGADNASA